LVLIVFLFSCQGGSSSSVTGPSSFAPVLKTGYYYPSSVRVCSVAYAELHVPFEDADGDMNGGILNILTKILLIHHFRLLKIGKVRHQGQLISAV